MLCTIFCFALINYVTNMFLLLSSSERSSNYCVLCMVKTKRAMKNMQQRILSSFITIPLY